MKATLIFAIFALAFIGVMLVIAALLDRRRVKDVHDFIPERAEGAVHPIEEHGDEPGHERGHVHDIRDAHLHEDPDAFVHTEDSEDGATAQEARIDDAERRGRS